MATLEAGNFFGERALLKDEPRNATVRALEDTDLYTLSKENFLAALHSSPSFKDQLLRVFAGREDAS